MNRNQYELYHYGVKGMKWGVRKKRAKSDTVKMSTLKQEASNRIKRAKRYINEDLIGGFKEGMLEGLEESRRITMNASYQQAQAAYASDRVMRDAINASNMAASLSMSGGTNPYMFGMM